MATKNDILAKLTGDEIDESQSPRKDFIAHGSPEHAALLGLKKSEKDDKFQQDGWTLADVTQWGPNATEDYIRAQLVYRVNELKNPPSVPKHTPPMWKPGKG